jgi:NADP-dependent 3-hydroxy acid dehydrogenase YdfG
MEGLERDAPIEPHALVVGGGGRLGSVLARELSGDGYDVRLWGRTSSGLAAQVDLGTASAYDLLDIADATAVDEGTDELLATGHSFGVVVNTAGTWTPGDLSELASVDIERHLLSVVNGGVHAARAAIRLLGDDGVYVQVAAACARPGYPDTALNTLAKRAQDGLQEALVRELRRLPRPSADGRVRVTTIYPDTIAPEGTDAVVSGMAMTYEDVARAVMFAIHAPRTVDIREITLTAPNSGQWTSL